MSTPTLRAALDYAGLGWRVVPIPQGSKSPRLRAWQDVATTDPATIHSWWSQWPGDGVGIVTGRQSGIFVLDVDVSDGKLGDETLADLEATYGPLPDTLEVVTGSGGRHLYFLWPEDREIRNDQAGRLGPGLDVRGEGGQVLAPPTIHPTTGRAYEHEASTQVIDGRPLVAYPPTWLLDLLAPLNAPPIEPRRVRVRLDGDTPGDRFNASTTWPDLLEADGAVLVDTRIERETMEPYELWSRPPMRGEESFVPHISASLYYKGSDVLKVFTSNWRGDGWQLEQERTYDRFGYFAARHFDGDHSAAAQAWLAYEAEHAFDGWEAGELPPAVVDLAAVVPDLGEDGWEPVDLGALLAEGYSPPTPTLLVRDDGRCLLYAGRVNSIFGESGSGKSWVALHACAQVLGDDGRVVYIDYEDTPGGVVHRLRSLGVPADTIAERFVYISPDARFGPRAAARLAAMVAGVDLVVVDSTGEAMASEGVKPNDDDDTARWFHLLPRYLARLGPAVLVLDHVPKGSDGPMLYAIGSQRKRAAIDGASYRIDASRAPSIEQDGYMAITVAKDRHGNYTKGKVVADVHVANTLSGVAIYLNKPPDSFRPTFIMGEVSRYIEDHDGCTRREVDQNVRGAKKDVVKVALDLLVAEEYVDERPRSGRGGGYTLHHLRPYRPEEDGHEND